MSQESLEIKASKTFKWVYCLTLVGYIFPLGVFSSSGWIGLTTGGGIFRYGYVYPAILLTLFLARIVYVIRRPRALDVCAAYWWVRAGRFVGMFLMYMGLAGVTGILLIKPLTDLVFSGLGFYVVGMLLVMLASVGLPGLVVFEVSRLLGGRRSRRPQE